jgi:hypothetical protein
LYSHLSRETYIIKNISTEINKFLEGIEINQRNVALITRGVSHNSTNKIHLHISQIYYLMSPQASSEVQFNSKWRS